MFRVFLIIALEIFHANLSLRSVKILILCKEAASQDCEEGCLNFI